MKDISYNQMIKVIFSTSLIFLFLTPSMGSDKGRTGSFDGVMINYEALGEKSPTLVFIHGWCCDRNYWKHQSEYFSKLYKVILIDLAGHGESSHNRKEWSMEAYGQDILAVISDLNERDVILVGHSAGAFAAMAAAVLLDEKVRGVIGVDGLRISYDGYLEKRFDEDFYAQIEENYIDGFAPKMKASVPGWFLDGADTNLVMWVAEDMSQTPPDIAIPAAQAYYKYRNGGLQNALKSVGNKIPIIEINAVERYGIAADHVLEYAPLFEAVPMTGVGHFLMMEEPEEFNQILQLQIDRIIQ